MFVSSDMISIEKFEPSFRDNDYRNLQSPVLSMFLIINISSSLRNSKHPHGKS